MFEEIENFFCESLETRLSLKVPEQYPVVSVLQLYLVSCLSWNDGILVTASWDSTVKVKVLFPSTYLT